MAAFQVWAGSFLAKMLEPLAFARTIGGLEGFDRTWGQTGFRFRKLNRPEQLILIPAWPYLGAPLARRSHLPAGAS